MHDTLEIHSRVGPDGTLDLHVPLGEAQAGTEVVVTIRPLTAAAHVKADAADWRRFVDETYGSCADLSLERQPQGEFEEREVVE